MKITLEKALKKLLILQERDNTNKMFMIYEPKQQRLNPYNPISYVFALSIVIVEFLCDVWALIKQIRFAYYFKW